MAIMAKVLLRQDGAMMGTDLTRRIKDKPIENGNVIQCTSRNKDKDINNNNPSSIWKSYKLTTLLILISCLVYVTFSNAMDEDIISRVKKCFAVGLCLLVAFSLSATSNVPFTSPHPVFWRLISTSGILYILLLIYILIQSPWDARQLMKVIDNDLGEPIRDKDYGGNCLIYDSDVAESPWHNIWDKMDIFIISHLFGHWCKTFIFRDWKIITVISIMFEFLEYSLEHQLANFSECWWDHWIVDVVICNGGGTFLGMLTLQWLSTSSHRWTMYEWSPLQSLPRWLTVICVIAATLIVELNTFYLKYVLWVPPNHLLNPIRLLFILLWSSMALREIVFWRMGEQTWVLVGIICTESLVCVKFGWDTVTKPAPSEIAVCWLIGGILLGGFTVSKFYFVKPQRTTVIKCRNGTNSNGHIN